MPARHRLDRYDEYGQDTWVAPDEEFFAAEMGQPSTEPNPAHAPAAWAGAGDADDFRSADEDMVVFRTPKVLAQTPVRCNKCERLAVPFEDVIVLVDGCWFHEGCVGEES